MLTTPENATNDKRAYRFPSRIEMSRFRRAARSAALILVGLTLLTEAAVGQSRQNEKPLTNDDVVAMVKAGLSEAVIIASIKNSRVTFQTTAAGLIALKQAGVSDRVIEVILESVRREPSVSTPGSSTTPLPSAFGYYIVGDDLVELKAVPVVTKFGLTLADRGFAVDGLPQEPVTRIAVNRSRPLTILGLYSRICG